MSRSSRFPIARRAVLGGLAAVPAALAVGVRVRQARAQGGTLAPTPACGEGPTPRNPEGPFFTPDTPRRTSLLEPGVEGTRLVLVGLVVSTDCRPIPGALLDFWQADAGGAYDNAGYRLRGHQFADDQGRYRLETIVPGNYGPRTRHVHVKAQAPNGPVLTTQLYFPGEPRNAADALFRPDLLVEAAEGANGVEARFDFVVETG